MKKTGKTAVGGILTALSVAAMFLTAVLPFFTYILPIAAGILMIVAVREFGRFWSAGIFAAVSALSFLVVVDKEAALMYTAFFGYYPIIKENLERLPKALGVVLKFLIFNVAVTTAYFLLLKLFGVPAEEFGEFGKYTVYILLGLGNVVFVLYDFLLAKLTLLYTRRLQKRVHALLK